MGKSLVSRQLSFVARLIIFRRRLTRLLLLALFSYAHLAIAAPLQISFEVNGYSLLAELKENTQLLEKISNEIPDTSQKHFKGQLVGHPESSIRVSTLAGHWRGILVLDGQLYKIDSFQNPMAASASGIQTHLADINSAEQMLCASASIDDDQNILMANTHSSLNSMQSLLSDISVNSIDTVSAQSVTISTGFAPTASASINDVCANPINGVCLLPEIEFAYDISYQNLPGSETSLQRAMREINELELFFESGFGFQFSRLSLTMLNSSQDSLIGSSDNPNTLLNRLRILRGTNQLPYVQNSRSIFHLVTGRNFPTIPGPDGGNVIGIAYLDQVCQSFGLNTGLTDAGDTSLVSLVMAHEIGHNMGARHDEAGVNGCPENQNVMSPSLGFFASGFTSFSSCSIASISQSVADELSTACFDFPIDIGLSADPNNPLSPDTVDPFDLLYTVNVEDGYIAVNSVTINGSVVNPTEGRFINVSVDGGSCSTLPGSYSCTVNNPASSFQLTATSTVNEDADAFSVQHTVGTTTASVSDVIPLNNTVNLTLNSFGVGSGEPAPGTNTGSGGGAINNTDVNPEPSGGGGGGALNPFGIVLMMLVAVVRNVARQFRK